MSRETRQQRIQREDVWRVLDAAEAEVPAVLDALRAGRIDGNRYASIEIDGCCCLLGTIARERRVGVFNLPHTLLPSISEGQRPAEVAVLKIAPGHTPSNNTSASRLEAWILEWQAQRGEGDLVTSEWSRK